MPFNPIFRCITILLLLTAPLKAEETTWRMLDSGTNAGLRGIHSINGRVAWASGTGGTVLRTLDGGLHWLRCTTPPNAEKLDFRGVEGWDAMTAMVMASGPGEQSRLYKTTDGCKSWSLLLRNPDAPDGFFDSFWLERQSGRGMLLGDPVKDKFTVFITADGGQTWKRRTEEGLDIQGKSLGAFAASNSSIAHENTGFQPFFAGGGKAGAILFRAEPDGHWQSANLPLAGGTEGSGVFSLSCRMDRCIAVGGDYSKPNESTGTAAWSADNGRHWVAATQPPRGYRSAVAWSDSFHAWIAAGTNGSDLSRDNGKTWLPLDNENWNALSLPFAVGPRGRIAKLKGK